MEPSDVKRYPTSQFNLAAPAVPTHRKLLPMITRFALFEGQVNPGETEAFRAAVLAEVLPHWKAFPGVLAVRVCFATERDADAPELPLILAISYPDRAAVDVALASSERAAAKAATESVLARFFRGRIHHHITEAHDHVSK
jgi:hypothetical protein